MDFTGIIRLEVQKARNDAFVWGVSTWTGYRWGGPADSATSGVEWLNVLGTSHEISVKRGGKRDGLKVAVDAGTLNATVYDPAVDPNTNPYVKPGTPVRLIHETDLGDVAVFTGVVNTVNVSYRNKKPTVVISAVDRVKDLANINRGGVVAGTFSERVDDLLSKHGIPNEVVLDGTDPALARNAYDSSLLNHLDLAAMSAKASIYVDKNNVVRGKTHAVDEVINPVLLFTDQRADTGAGSKRVNYILNPSFELGMEGWEEDTGTAYITNMDAYNGSNALVKDAPDLGGYASMYVGSPAGPATIAVDAGKTYSLSFQVKGVYGGTASIDWFDAANNELRYDAGPWNPLSDDGTWGTVYLNNVVPPAGAAYAKVYMYGERATAGTIAMDAVLLTEGTTTGDYFDGDTLQAFWVGERHNSRSILDPSLLVEYTDIVARYASDAMANDIFVNNLTYAEDEEGNPVSVSTKYGPYRNVTSIATYGAYTEEVETNLEDEAAVADWAVDVLAANDAPELRVESIRFNASNQPERASGLDVFDTVNVEYTNDAFHIGEAFRVLGLEHQITASNDEHRWMVNVDLISLEDN